jgi:hypothetical protein
MRRVPLSVEPPAFPGAGLSQDVYLNSITPLTVIGSGGGGGGANPSFSTITVADQLTVIENANISSLNVSSIQATSIVGDFLNGVNTLFGRGRGQGLTIDNSQGIGGGNINIITDTTGNTFGIYATTAFLSTSALYVSSINGAVPGDGGTVPPDLTLSTLNVSTITSPTGVNKILGSLDMTGGDIGAINTISATSAELTQLFIDSINPKTLATESITICGNNYLSTLIIDSAVVNISNNLIVSSINSVPIFTLAQYQALSTLAA